MIKEADIKIESQQFNVDGNTGDNINNSIKENYDYKGTVAEKDGALFVSYNQQEEGRVTQNRLIIYDDHLVRTSKGDSFSRMEFYAGRETKTVYSTAYGTFDMTFTTKYYSVNKNEKQTSFTLEYLLSINGAPSSEITMKVEVNY